MAPVIRPFGLLLLLTLALSAAEVHARFANKGETMENADDSAIIRSTPPLIDPLRLARQTTSAVSTVTVVKTTTLSSATTVTITTKKICGVLASVSGKTKGTGDAAAYESDKPATACRRRRHLLPDPIFLAFDDPRDVNTQFVVLNPTQVLSFRQTMLPMLRANIARKPTIELTNRSPALDSSFQQSPENVRTETRAQIFGFNFSSVISSLVSSLANAVLSSYSTTTSTVTAYSTTSTWTSYSATSAYYILGTCYPASATIC